MAMHSRTLFSHEILDFETRETNLSRYKKFRRLSTAVTCSLLFFVFFTNAKGLFCASDLRTKNKI